jgi:hypothetical protein
LELAGLLIEVLANGFEPDKYKDTYHANLWALPDECAPLLTGRGGRTAPFGEGRLSPWDRAK